MLVITVVCLVSNCFEFNFSKFSNLIFFYNLNLIWFLIHLYNAILQLIFSRLSMQEGFIKGGEKIEMAQNTVSEHIADNPNFITLK